MLKGKLFGILLCLPLLTWGHGEEQGHEEKPSNQVRISSEMAATQHIKINVAQPGEIAQELAVVGKVTPNRDHIAPIYPRFTGIVKSLTKRLGDTVNANEVIARVESNESLQVYDIRSPMTGVVTQKLANVGALVKEDKAIYEIADLSKVWVDLSIYRKDAPKVKLGQIVSIQSEDDTQKRATSKIDYISPIGIEDNQTMLARVVLPNQSQEWLPGMFVDAEVTLKQKSVAIRVPSSALQTMNNETVIFVVEKDIYTALPVQIGLQNQAYAEVISGLKVGQYYVAENSFIVKADIGKGAAEHED